MNREELEKLYLETDLGLFTPDYTIKIINDDEAYTMTKDAQTKYNEEVARRNATIVIETSLEERIADVEIALAEMLGV